MTLTFESVDKILCCYHSNGSSLPVLTHGAVCFSILQNEIWKSGRNLPLATFGSERVKATEYLLTLGFFNLFLCKVDLIYFEHAD